MPFSKYLTFLAMLALGLATAASANPKQRPLERVWPNASVCLADIDYGEAAKDPSGICRTAFVEPCLKMASILNNPFPSMKQCWIMDIKSWAGVEADALADVMRFGRDIPVEKRDASLTALAAIKDIHPTDPFISRFLPADENEAPSPLDMLRQEATVQHRSAILALVLRHHVLAEYCDHYDITWSPCKD